MKAPPRWEFLNTADGRVFCVYSMNKAGAFRKRENALWVFMLVGLRVPLYGAKPAETRTTTSRAKSGASTPTASRTSRRASPRLART